MEGVEGRRGVPALVQSIDGRAGARFSFFFLLFFSPSRNEKCKQIAVYCHARLTYLARCGDDRLDRATFSLHSATDQLYRSGFQSTLRFFLRAKTSSCVVLKLLLFLMFHVVFRAGNNGTAVCEKHRHRHRQSLF